MHSLPLFVRLKDRPVILIGEGANREAKRRLLERAGARIIDEDGSAALAIVVMEGDAAEAVAARLKARGILINVADRPDLCDFTLPAIVDRDPVLIAVGTGGASAGLAKAIRQRIEALLPTKLGALATSLYQARARLRRRLPDAADRRRALDLAMAAGGALDPLQDDAADHLPCWLETDLSAATDQLIDIPLSSPDPEELTLRTARLLGEADTLYHHADVPIALLNRARADAARIVCSDRPDQPAPGLSLYLRMR